MHYSKLRSSVHILCTLFPEAHIRTDHSHRLLVRTLNSLNLHYDHAHMHMHTHTHIHASSLHFVSLRAILSTLHLSVLKKT